MKRLLTLVAIGLVQQICNAADCYSVEATITPLRDGKQYEAVCRVCKLVDRNGGQREELLSNPRIRSVLGEQGSFYVGPDRSSSDYKKTENVSGQVVWPEDGQAGFAECTITVKRGDKVLARSKMQIMVGKNKE